MKVIQSPQFAKKIKKLHKNQKMILDTQILKIIENPYIGEEKKCDLKGIFVHKFKMMDKQYLLAYRILETHLELVTVGPHENYYRDLKRYLTE